MADQPQQPEAGPSSPKVEAQSNETKEKKPTVVICIGMAGSVSTFKALTSFTDDPGQNDAPAASELVSAYKADPTLHSEPRSGRHTYALQC
jgi:hypothetical protein